MAVSAAVVAVAVAVAVGVVTVAVEGHNITVSIPAYRRVGEGATLLCKYDLGGEGLYSVKWFKDGVEFYRFMPRTVPAKLVFQDVAGVHVNTESSDERLVRLERLAILSTGYYHCEVSEEAPNFRTSSGGGTLVVVELAANDPFISGQSEVYQHGGLISLNCTSHPSRPAAVLMWFANQQPVNSRYLQPYPVQTSRDHLQSSTLGLALPISSHLFRSSLLRLTCAAYIQAYNYASESYQQQQQQQQQQQPPAQLPGRPMVRGRLIQRRQTSFLVRSSASRAYAASLESVNVKTAGLLLLLLLLLLTSRDSLT